MRYARVPIVFLFAVSAIVAPATRLRAQVTTATLFGIVRDTTGAALPGANVTMTHEGDMTIAKNIPLGHTRLQFRADAFNVLNHVNLNNPNGNFISPDFGRITGAATMRTGQVGVRLSF